MPETKITLKVHAKGGETPTPLEVDTVLEKALRRMRGERQDTVLPDDTLERYKNSQNSVFQVVMDKMIDEIVALI